MVVVVVVVVVTIVSVVVFTTVCDEFPPVNEPGHSCHGIHRHFAS